MTLRKTTWLRFFYPAVFFRRPCSIFPTIVQTFFNILKVEPQCSVQRYQQSITRMKSLYFLGDLFIFDSKLWPRSNKFVTKKSTAPTFDMFRNFEIRFLDKDGQSVQSFRQFNWFYVQSLSIIGNLILTQGHNLQLIGC